MTNSRVIRTTLTAAVLGLGAVTALASTAGAATQPVGPSAASTAPGAGSQDIHLSDGSVAHVTDLGHGQWQAWVTHHGTRIADLDPTHSSSRVHGYTYELNQANGFVGVTEPSGWHSESDQPRPDHDRHQQDIRRHQGTPDHKNQAHRQQHKKHSGGQAIGTTRDVKLPGGAIAHITHVRTGQWQAWITLKGVRIADLYNGHTSAHTHGHTYTLNVHTGTVTAHK
ncbi:hypothetical protein ACVHNB_21775 [Streptomyces sp. YJ-C3]